MPLSQPNDLHNVRQRLGSLMMLHDRGGLRTDFRPLRLTVTYHAPCHQHEHGIGERLTTAQADSDLAGAIDDLAARLR
jgi:hypothetical protein